MTEAPRIAVLTMVDYKNFGNRLQNYAVHRLVEQSGGRPTTIEIVDSRMRTFARDTYYATIRDSVQAHMLRGSSAKFVSFTHHHISKSSVKDADAAEHLSQFDACIVGSDQVWNPSDRRLGGRKSGIQYLNGVHGTRKISLAASFGVEFVGDAIDPRAGDWLRDFSHLSVREQSGRSLVKELSGREARVLLDPTLAYGPHRWRGLASNDLCPDTPYGVEVFLSGVRSERRNAMDSFFRRHRLDSIRHTPGEQGSPFSAAGPQDFLGLLSNAEVVFTDSYHCAAFAFIFDRPLAIFERETDGVGTFNRLTQLAKWFGLEDRLHSARDLHFDDRILEHDYAHGFRALDALSDDFSAYLDHAFVDLHSRNTAVERRLQR